MFQTYGVNVLITVTECYDRFPFAHWLPVLVDDFPAVGGQA
jgi:hypothetical protein